MGKPDVFFFTRKIFGEDVVEAKRVYVTLNTLMGKEYLKPEEREVLLPIGAELKAVCRGYDYNFLGKDGKPALVYDVDVMAPSMKVPVYSKADEVFLFDEKIISKIRAFFEQLNNNIVSGEFPEYPEQYLIWKAAFKRVAMNKVYEVYCCE